jgi:hypothetical protein
LGDRSSELTPAEFLHLCFHGAAHGWARLKWLGDIAAICDRKPDIWAVSAKASESLGLGLAAAQTRLLLQALYDAEPMVEQCPPRTYVLAATSIKEMHASDPNRQLSMRGWWKRHRYRAALGQRSSLFDRFLRTLSVCLFEEEQLLRSRTGSLIGLPFARARSLFRRYVFTGDF